MSDSKPWRGVMLAGVSVVVLLLIYVMSYVAYRQTNMVSAEAWERAHRFPLRPHYQQALSIRSQGVVTFYTPLLELDRWLFGTFIEYVGHKP